MRKGFAPIIIVGLIAAFVLGIGATAAYFKLQQKPVPLPQPSPNAPSAAQSPNPDSSPDPTADWKTYTGDNFTFRYPQDWNIAGKSDDYLARVYCWQCVNPNGFSINVVPYKSSDEYLKSNPNAINTNPTPIDTKQTLINGETAIEILIPPYQGIGLVQYFLNHKGQDYILTYEAYSSTTNKITNLPKPNTDILTTFKFIEP